MEANRSKANAMAGEQPAKMVESQETSAAKSPTRDSRSVLRLQELKAQRDEILKQVKAQLAAKPPLEHPNIHDALDDFCNFFGGYTSYFLNLPPEEVEGSGRTFESVLSRVLDNTRRIWEELSMAINQRYNPVYADKLSVADQKAQRLLQRANAVVRGMPILYFDKVFQITRHPYQTYPLLGLSLDRFEFDGDSSLAHELGHHVFWNNGELNEYAARLDAIDERIARIILVKKFPDVDFANPLVTQRAIRSRFDQYSAWVGWIEETFADVFGVLMTGPRFAKSGQDMLIRERLAQPRDLLVSDGEHPVPGLRPFIAIEVLRYVAKLNNDPFGQALTALVNQLEKRWQPIWDEAIQEDQRTTGAPASALIGHSHSDEPPAVTLQDLRAQVAPMVELILREEGFSNGGSTDGQNGGEQKRDLLAVLDYWGKGRTQDELNEIAALRSELNDDLLTPISSRIAQIGGGLESASGGEDDELFKRFLEFVQQRSTHMAGEGAPSLKEWQKVLDFDLTLNHHIHDYCKSHGGDSCHYHTYSGEKVYC